MTSWTYARVDRRFVAGLTLSSTMMLPAIGWAQTTVRVTPSLNAALVYDSNLFARHSDPQGDVISRLTPAIDAEYRSATVTLLGRYSLDSERFTRDAQLSTVQARQHASLDVRYHPRPRLIVGAEATLAKTQTPGELNLRSGLTVGRASARRLAARSMSTYQLDPVTKGTVEYAFTNDHLAGGVGLTAHSTMVAGERRLSLRDMATADYMFRRLDFGPAEVVTSHTFSVGWTHELTRRTTVSLRGGPRIGDGEVAPELSASMSYRLSAAELSLTYARRQTTLIGLAGATETDDLSATAAYGRPASYQIRISPGIMQTARAGLAARVYRMGLGASYPIGRRLALDTAYDVSVQDGDLYTAHLRRTIVRHLLSINLTTVTRPFRP